MSSFNTSDAAEEAMCVFLEDDGVELSPAAEASVLMAAATANGGEALRPYAEDVAVFESERLRSVSTLTAGLAALRAMPAIPVVYKNENIMAPVEGIEEEGDGEEWGMLMGPSGSVGWMREATDGDDWVLAEILARRMDRALGAHTYLCKWKHFPENTWETRETLEDEGHKAAVDAADAARRDHLQHRKTLTTFLIAQQSEGAKKKEPLPVIPVDRRSVLEEAVSKMDGVTATIFRRLGHELCFIVPVLPQAREAAFLETWDRLQDTHRPILLFHGTSTRNIPSIVQHSLVVPGTGHGVTVANGSAHGVGIYTAFCPSTSFRYTALAHHRTSNTYRTNMFVCLGLVSNKDKNVFQTDCAVVFFDAALVVPLWLVQVAQMESNTATRTTSAKTDQKIPIVNPSANTEKRQEREALSEATGGVSVDAAFVRRPMTKKMVKAAPRYVKDLFRQGKLSQK